MRSLPFLYLTFSLCLCNLESSAVDWIPYGPPGGAVLNLLSDPGQQTFYAVCSSQIYQSTDEGDSWNALAPPESQYEYYADGAVVGDDTPTLLAALYTGGLRRWNPTSRSWETANNGITPPPSGYALQGFDLSVGGVAGNRVFFGCSTGLYYSDNQGELWTKIPYPNDAYPPSKVEAASDGGVFIYTYTPIRIAPKVTDATFFVGKPGLPYRSLDQTMIWPNPANPQELLLTFPYYPTQEDFSVFYSTDGGENWTLPSQGTVPTSGLRGLWLGGAPTILGATGTWTLDPMQQKWSPGFDFGRSSGWRILPLPSVNAYLLGSQDRGIWKTVNGGAMWEYSSNGMKPFGSIYAMAANLSDEKTIYVGLQQSGVWMTDDDAGTWREMNQGFQSDPAYGFSIRSLAINPTNPNHLLAGTETTGGLPAVVYQSFDGGESWAPISNGPTNICIKVHFVRTTPGVILLGTLGGGVWRSPDNGTNWSSDPVFPQYSNITDITEEAGGRLFACQTATFNTQGGIYISDNAGANWTFSMAAGGFRSMAADPLVPGRVMGGYEAGGTHLSVDNGATWNPASTGLPGYLGGSGAVEGLVAHPTVSGIYYLALTGYGVYETRNDGGQWTAIGGGGWPLALSIRNEGTLFSASGGILASKLEVPIVDLPDTPTPTPTGPIPTPTPTPPSNPPTWFPGPRTPTPTPVQSLNVGMTMWGVSISPKSPATTGSVSVGVTLYNDSRADLTNVAIECSWSLEGGPWNSMGRVVLPNLMRNFELEIPAAASFQPTAGGTYTVRATLDPDNAIEESNEVDNVREASFYVRAGGGDFTPPTGGVRAAGGNPFTSNWDVGLEFFATDVGSGVAFLRLEAFAFNPYSGGLASYYDSGWVDFRSYYPFLSSLIWTGDIDAYAVNYADWEGNVSNTYWAAVTYCQTQFTEFVFYDEIVYYPFYMGFGQHATISLQNVWGDADLFVIAPSDPPGYGSWFSQNEGSTSENIAFTAPEEGVYWIGVFGYDWSEYRLLCSGSSKIAEADAGARSMRKDRRAPSLDSPGNGTLIERGINVPTPGVDFDGNGILNSLDLFYLAANWGLKSGDPGYDARCGALAPAEPVGSGHLLKWMSAMERR